MWSARKGGGMFCTFVGNREVLASDILQICFAVRQGGKKRQ
jgi:hypothetical protein